MKTYIVANSHTAFDAVVRDRQLHRPDAVRIRSARDVRGLSLQRDQVLYARDAETIDNYREVAVALDLAFAMGTSQDDKRTHRLTITDLDGGVVGTRMVTARQAKDALG